MICKQNILTIDKLAIHMKEEHYKVCGIFATKLELVKPMEKMGKHEDDHHRILCNLCCSNLPTKTRFRTRLRSEVSNST